VGKPEGRRPLQRPSSRWEDNIKMNFKEMGWDRWRTFVNAVMTFGFHKKKVIC
jgi:hypothetical protein